MKKILIAAAALAWASIASAGTYHVGKYLLCYDCHSMHGSQSHGFGGGTVAVGPTAGAKDGDWQYSTTNVYEYLLKGAESESCMACHDAKTFAPDVIGGPTATYARSAGSIADGSAGHEAYKGHTLDAAATVPGADTGAGQAGTLTLTCFNCHIQHGMANSYRNLGSRSIAASQPTYAVVAKGSATDMTKDVTIKVDAAAMSGTSYVPQGAGNFGDYYSMDFVSYAVTTAANMTNRLNDFCAMCHGAFHGQPGGGAVGNGASGPGVGGELVNTDVAGWEAFTRHPTAGVKVGGLLPVAPATSNHGHTSATGLNAKATKIKAAQANAGDFVNASPMCISCHNAHGSTKPFGLRFIAGNVAGITGEALENGTGHYPNLCNQCHGQGTSNVEDYTGSGFVVP